MHRINVIKSIAAIDPARAEALLATYQNPNQIADNLPALCYAMARKDPARARRLVYRGPGDRPIGQVRAFCRPYAIGMIALALADTDRARAARFLDEAFAALGLLAAEGRRGFPKAQDAATIAAALVPVAERIDPALVPEFFWRAASFRVPPRSRPDDAATRDATLALLLARYDRDAAMVVLTPLLDRGSFPEHHDPSILARALAAIAPERAVAARRVDAGRPGRRAPRPPTPEHQGPCPDRTGRFPRPSPGRALGSDHLRAPQPLGRRRRRRVLRRPIGHSM